MHRRGETDGVGTSVVGGSDHLPGLAGRGGRPGPRRFSGDGLQVAAALARRRHSGSGGPVLAAACSPRRLPAAREQAIVSCRRRCRVGPHRIGWMLGEAPSTVHAVLRRQQLRGCGSWTDPPARWCATSATGLESWSTSTSRSRAGSPDGGGHLMLGRAAGHRDRRHGWPMTSCMSPWTTARGWRIWRSIPMSAARRRLASPAGRWPGSPDSGSPWRRS
jgi:hypothetical protein